VTGEGRRERRGVRTCLSAKEKLEIVEFLERHDMPATLTRYFRCLAPAAQSSKRRSIYQWRASRTELERRAADPKLANMKYVRPPGIATVLTMDTERDIVGWINLLRKDGVPVSSLMLQYKALDAAKEAGVEPFSASWHWQKGFLRRHRLSLRARTRQGQITLAEADAVAIAFGAKVQQTMAKLGVTKVHNADQTGDVTPHTFDLAMAVVCLTCSSAVDSRIL
jgi:hypothetical protein